MWHAALRAYASSVDQANVVLPAGLIMKKSWNAWEMACLVACAVGAFLIRSTTYHDLIGPRGELLFLDPDSYDHLRRVTLGLAEFPKIPAFDSYYGYPVGTGQVWSPFFDYLISALLFLVKGRIGGAAIAETAGFWLSPALAALTVF